MTVNTDNRLITDTTVTKELLIATARWASRSRTWCTLIVQGFKSAFLPFREKSDLLKQVNREIAETLSRFAAGPRAVERPAQRSVP